MRVPAVVGSFPEPFLHGIDGKRLPVRVECATRTRRRHASRCPSALVAYDIPAATGGLLSRQRRRRRCASLVGPWPALRGDHAIQRPRGRARATSGVYARSRAPTGAAIALLDPRGHAVRTLGAGAGLVAATQSGDDRPIWVVTGTDDAGVAAAVRAFDGAARSTHRFAVAVERRPCRFRRARWRDDLPPPRQPAARRARRRPAPATASRSPRCALAFENPTVLVALAIAVAVRGGRGGRRARGRAHGPLALPLAVLVAVINALVVRDGLTVLARLGEVPPFGQIDITLEALVYGLRARRAGARDRAVRSRCSRRPSTPTRCCACCAACRFARR